ncbi:peroxiredoxin family protein [Peribacillus sp. B-H-3]|uniref:peroxiredoxin family protein n=1 Tax=Peribacillus sp. B-H-3 TaxID=3400420 RepID=UPI003B02D170
MIKKIIAASVLILLITVAIVQAMDDGKEKGKEGPQKSGSMKIGEKAPDFELNTLEGKKVKLSEFKGKKVLINFWATWCEPCKEEMPHLEEFYKKSASDTAVLAINIDPENDVKGYAGKMGLTFPILLDNQEKSKAVNERYGVAAVPSSFLVDSKGIIRQKFIGAINFDVMKKSIGQLK